MYYAEETMANDILHWWDRWDNKFLCSTWNDMKAVLQHQFAHPLKSKQKVAIAHGPNLQGTKENVRSSWADTIVEDKYLPDSNRLASDINSYKKLGSGVIYGKSVHAVFSSLN
jgi:hypothetical protein